VLYAVAEYGDRFVERLNGMFGIALWDGVRRRTLVGRDRLGNRPLYIAALVSRWLSPPKPSACSNCLVWTGTSTQRRDRVSARCLEKFAKERTMQTHTETMHNTVAWPVMVLAYNEERHLRSAWTAFSRPIRGTDSRFS